MKPLYDNYKSISENLALLEQQKENAFKQIVLKASENTPHNCIEFEQDDNTPFFDDDTTGASEHILAIKVNENNDIMMIVGEQFDGDFSNEQNWFRANAYGTFDMDYVAQCICD